MDWVVSLGTHRLGGVTRHSWAGWCHYAQSLKCLLSTTVTNDMIVVTSVHVTDEV